VSQADVDAAREGVLRAFQERDGRRLDVVTFSLLRQDLR
jgi:RimJ/RimL family protein N-acetyltransferase